MAAATQAATVVEKIIGNTSDATITTDVSNPAQKDYGDQDGARMKALTWNGKNSVKLGGFSFFFSPLFSFSFLCPGGFIPFACLFVSDEYSILLTLVTVETAKPRIIEDGDVIVKVTGSTICGSDLHLYHGMLYFHDLVPIPRSLV